jgi:hypothetical protein
MEVCLSPELPGRAYVGAAVGNSADQFISIFLVPNQIARNISGFAASMGRQGSRRPVRRILDWNKKRIVSEA